MRERKIIAGNWKMNQTLAEAGLLVSAIVSEAGKVSERSQLLIAPPFTLLHPLAEMIKDTDIILAAQDCHFKEKGAHTGDISASMIADSGASHVIIGHSERRADHNESENLLSAKIKSASKAGLVPIYCVGESLAERDGGQTQAVIGQQLKDGLIREGQVLGASEIIIAYEPFWAIGTGITPSSQDAQSVHRFIRTKLRDIYGQDFALKVPILYGGSMKPENAKGFLSEADIDGGLIGGASLKADDFLAIARASL